MVLVKSKSKKKIVLLSVVALALLLGGIVFAVDRYVLRDNDKSELPVGGVNYDPPTSVEKNEAEEHKKTLEQQVNAPSGSTDVIITSLSVGETRGYISGIVEDGGTCSLTLTKGDVKVTGSSTALGDVNKTTCGPISITSPQLTSGEWNASLSYISPSTSSTSEIQKLRVP